jgi:hypothetical protein
MKTKYHKRIFTTKPLYLSVLRALRGENSSAQFRLAFFVMQSKIGYKLELYQPGRLQMVLWW